MKLTAMAVDKAKPKEKIYRLFDGYGLYLEVSPKEGKYWRIKYYFNDKERRLGLGVYPIVSLADAREKCLNAKKMLDKGIDPAEEKKLKKLEKKQEYENNFENIAREWHKQQIHTWKPKHAENIMKRLEANIFPDIGKRPISAIKASEILESVRKVEARGNRDLAHRIMQTCSQVFRYGVATSRVERDITTDLRGALIPAKSKSHAYLSEKELPAFLKDLENYDTEFRGKLITKLAFKLLILTFLRSGELRGGKWEEIDWEKKQWKIPAERMKMDEPQIVPLATQTIELLKQLKELCGDNYGGFILPNQNNPRKTLSENTFLRAIQVMGYKGKTVAHGFRSTASTILNENRFPKDVIERQLAHAERDQVRAAYNYAQYIPEREKMMQWWADYLEEARL